MRSVLLTNLIKEAFRDISNEKNFSLAVAKHVNIFKENGIYSEMHLDCNKNGEMEQDTEESKVLKLEWFAGNLIHLQEKNAYPFMQTWLNMVNNICR